jgi:hypothetical protein
MAKIYGPAVTTIEVTKGKTRAMAKNEEFECPIIDLDGKMNRGIIGCAAMCEGTGTLEVELHGSMDGANFENTSQAHNAVASDGAWDYSQTDWSAKSYQFLKVVLLENDVNPLTKVRVYVTLS